MIRLRFILRTSVLIAAILVSVFEAQAQRGRGFWHQEWTVERGDSIPLVHILPV